MDFEKNLRKLITVDKKTLLGIGPMSKNVTDSAIEIANEENIPLMLIASRRQVDSINHGGGYVENWTTEDFAKYVKEKDKQKNIILCRDHGGPWQNNLEIKDKLSAKLAMDSCKISFHEDIKNGFKIIHIDPSINPYKKNSLDSILNKIYELYEFCYSISKKYN